MNGALEQLEPVEDRSDTQAKRLEASHAVGIVLPLLPSRSDQCCQVRIVASVAACDFELFFRFAERHRLGCWLCHYFRYQSHLRNLAGSLFQLDRLERLPAENRLAGHSNLSKGSSP